MNRRAHRIFLVEDNPGDVRLIRESLRAQDVDYELLHYETVDEAVRAVRACGSDGNVPDLILLDFNLPRGDARDILAAASQNPALAGVPRAVVTSSLAPKDRDQAMKLGAACFINKPQELDAFLNEVGGSIVALLRTSGA
jgi:CheY-like chemotaxis protein